MNDNTYSFYTYSFTLSTVEVVRTSRQLLVIYIITVYIKNSFIFLYTLSERSGVSNMCVLSDLFFLPKAKCLYDNETKKLYHIMSLCRIIFIHK